MAAADEQDLAVSRIGRYRERRTIALTERGPEVAVRLARLAPWMAGIIHFCASRGDTPDEVARLLGRPVEAVDEALAVQDGIHHRGPGSTKTRDTEAPSIVASGGRFFDREGDGIGCESS